MSYRDFRPAHWLLIIDSVVLIIVVTAIVAWFVGEPMLSSQAISGTNIKFNAALSLAFLAIAAPIGYFNYSGRIVKNGALLLSVAAGCLGLLTIVEYLFGTDLHLDQAMVRDLTAVGNIATPGRMAFSTAVVIVGLSLATVLNLIKRHPTVAQLLAVVAAASCYFSVVSFSFNTFTAAELGSVTHMSVNAALAIFGLAISSFFSQADRGIAEDVVGSAIGGHLARRFLSLCFVIPLVIGSLTTLLLNNGYISPKMVLGSAASITFVVMVPIVLYFSRQLNRLSQGLSGEARAQSAMAHELKAVMDALPIGVLVIDAATRLPRSMNRRAEAILGPAVDQDTPGVFSNVKRLLDQHEHEYPLEQLPQLVAITEGREASGEAVAERPDGSRFTMYIHAVPILGETDVPVAAIVTVEDTTVAGEAQHQRLEFISLVSHQLKSPLTAVRWTLESLLSGDYGQTNPDQQTAMQQALGSTERMAAIVRDILNTYRIESGKIDFKPHWATAAEFLDVPATEARSAASVKRINVIYQNSSTRRLFIDTAMMQQAVINLLSNAVKYSPEGSTVEFTAEEVLGTLMITVADHGIGIPQDQQDKIFGKFFRADNAKLATTEGTGLGLYVSKEIVESFGGSLTLTSRPDHGTTFRIALPLATAALKAKE